MGLWNNKQNLIEIFCSFGDYSLSAKQTSIPSSCSKPRSTLSVDAKSSIHFMACKRISLSLSLFSNTLLHMQQTTECLETEGKMKTTTISGSERKMSRFVCFFSRYYLFKPLPFSHLMRSMFVYLVCVCGFKSNVREKHLPFSSSIDCWHTKNDVALTF